MKRLFLFFCLAALCSCNQEPIADSCEPVGETRFFFDSQEGIDSANIYGYWLFSSALPGCEVKPEKVECPWFSAVKKDNDAVIVSVKQNDTEVRSASVKINGDDGKGKWECSGFKNGWKEFTITQCSPDSIKVSKEELLFGAEGGIDSVTVINNNSSQSSLGIIGFAYIPYGFAGVINGSWYSIRIPDREKIVFSISKNETGKERDFIVNFKPCTSSEVKVTQSAE
jgi:hypothetical protein